MSTNHVSATLDALINRRASKIGWICAASIPVLAVIAGLAGIIPMAIGVPVSLLMFLLFGTLVKRTIAAGLKFGVTMSVYGRIIAGVTLVGLIMLGAAAPESRLGVFIVPVVLSLVVLDRLCGYVGRVEMVEVEYERAAENEAEREFDLLRPEAVVVEEVKTRRFEKFDENLSADAPTGKLNTVTVSPPASAGRVVIPNTPVAAPGSFSQWETEPPPVPAVS